MSFKILEKNKSETFSSVTKTKIQISLKLKLQPAKTLKTWNFALEHYLPANLYTKTFLITHFQLLLKNNEVIYYITVYDNFIWELVKIARIQNFTSLLNCTITKLRAPKFTRGHKIARRQFCTRDRYCSSYILARE